MTCTISVACASLALHSNSVKPSTLLLRVWLCSYVIPAWALPDGFVYVDQIIPDVAVELRYHSSRNFVGRPIDAYQSGRAILSKPAAAALAEVQAELRSFGLGIKIFDAYRPQRAVEHFVRWAEDLADKKTQAEYYPDIDKHDLFKQDYIARRSGHSRGSTVDVTLVALDNPRLALDMGTPFDFFSAASWPNYPGLTTQQRANRLLLQSVMNRHGFIPYPKEWWHFTLDAEPYPGTYFDFPVK